MEKNELNFENIDGIKILMDLGLKEVSNRTFIHESELTKFLSGDFANINKAKAMGFIQILQREFHIDLTPLKDKYLEYVKEHKELEPKVKESMIVEEVKSEERKKNILSILFLLLAIGSIVYLINKFDLLNFKKPVEVSTAIEKVEDENENINLNQLNSDNDIDKKQNEKVNKLNSEENNIQISKVLENNKQSSENESDNQQSSQNDDNQQNIDLSQLNKSSSDGNDENINQNLISSEQNASIGDDNSTQTSAVTNELYITPRLKVWIGTIEIDSLKKHDFLAKKGDRVDIDASKNKLIMIGHKFVDMYLNGEKIKFKKKGPIRFKYIDGKLEEIDRSEFNSLAKGRQW